MQRPIHILVVDDEPHNLDILRIFLKSLKYVVYEAVCGEEAIRMAGRLRPDLILLDVMLPDISGYEACKRLNEIPGFASPIIFLSSNTQKKDILKGLELGVFDYLTKPFDLEMLELKINSALQHRKNYERELNRRLEFDVMQARAMGTALSLVILQIDQYEMICNSLGPEAADTLFQFITTRLRNCCMNIDTILRQSSGNIVAAIPHAGEADQVSKVAEKIVPLLTQQPYIVEKTEIYLTVSIGISVFPYHGSDIAALLRNAEIAVHAAKTATEANKCILYNHEIEDRLSRRMKMQNRLRRALEKKELYLHYQPKMNIQNGELMGTEALIRWCDPELGMISPSEFIPIAEEIGMINEIGKWVIHEACKQNKKWNESGFHRLTVAINLSARQIESSEILQHIVDVLKETALDPHLLEFEITEGVLIHNTASALVLLNGLRRMGIRISIDDFGTGYSSLHYLKKFPIDCLKIDRSFIKDLTFDKDNTEITNAIISLAHTLSLKVIAEGVETEDQLQYLRNKQCDEVQGYFFSRPLSASELENRINNGTWKTASTGRI